MPKSGGNILLLKGLSELVDGVKKAACIQAMYERGRQWVAMAALVDPSHLKPLLRGLLDALKIHVQSLKERIQRAIEINQHDPHNSPHARFDLGGNATQYSDLWAREGME